MKKFYTNPKMTVSKFDMENVITSSGGDTVKGDKLSGNEVDNSETNSRISWNTATKDVTAVTTFSN